MPLKAKELSATEVRRITKPGRHAVGGVSGLLLVVKDTGAKSWILRTVVGTKRRNIGLGGFPDVGLAQARERARDMKQLILDGIDPVEERRARQKALIKDQAKNLSFAQAARLCHDKKSSEFRNAKHAMDWISSVNRYAIPIIGNIPVSEIDLPHILNVLNPIWKDKTETATRLRQRLEAILAWAAVSGHRSGDNPARWKGHLDAVLPTPNKIRKRNHFAALPWQEIGAFMDKLRKKDGMSARCLEFTILTAARSGESRLSTWDEIDLGAKVWTIPAERMKAGKEHKVPLTDRAIQILEGLPRFEGSEYVFTAPRGGPLSDMALSMLCRRMEVEAVPHGFRSTFRDWCSENTNYPREVAEMSLAHTIESKVEAAYRRGDLFQKRMKLMESWAEFCSKVQDGSAKVTPIRKAG
jgi:integrase